MSCNFLGSSCTATSPCCDGFNCNTGGVCDFYKFSSTQSCPSGYSKVYTSSDAGLCALDLKHYSRKLDNMGNNSFLHYNNFGIDRIHCL